MKDITNYIYLKRNGLLMLVSITLILFSGNLSAKEYYFSNDGDDSNSGTIESPWKTLAKATEISKQKNKGGILNPGDQLLFRKGDLFEGQLVVLLSGTESDPIVIGSYGEGELPILSGSGNIPNGDFHDTIKLTNTSYITVNDIWVKNDRKHIGNLTWGTNSATGIKVIANKWGGVIKGLTFRNLKITDILGYDMLDWEGNFTLDYYNVHGIFFDSEKNDLTVDPIKEIGIEDVLIEDCYFYNIGSRGINVRHLSNVRNNPIDDEDRNKNFIIRNNTFEKLGGDGIVFASLCNGLVEKNDFIDLGQGEKNNAEDRLFGRGEGIWIWDARNIIVQFNRQYRSSGFGDTYGAAGHIDFFSKNAIFQYNYSEDTEGGFVEILGDCVNSTFRFNVSVNDGQRDFHGYSIWVSGYVGTDEVPIRSDSNYIYNNTVYLNKSICQPDISIYAKNTYIYNNIFKVTNGAAIGADGVEIDIEEGSELVVSNNLFYGDISTNFTDLDQNKVVDEDPEFVNEGDSTFEGYKIKETSPAIDLGTKFHEPSFPMAGKGIFKNVSLYTATDIYGNPVDVRHLISNIGADNSFSSNLESSEIAVTAVEVQADKAEIGINETMQLTAQIFPLNAKNKNVTWSSKNSSIASVNDEGKVVGLTLGATEITATTEDGNFTSSFTINVIKDPVLSSDYFLTDIKVYPNPSSKFIQVDLGDNSNDFTLEIFSIWGQKVFESQVQNNATIDVRGFNKGTYTVVISDNQWKFSQKIIVQ